ncbi:MAG: cupin domain-containing protein [Terriglobia bacterium]
MELSRRQLCLLLPALFAAVPGFPAGSETLPAKAYPFADLPAHRHGGSESWPVLDGLTHSGFQIELHETQLAPGARPHPPHHHTHEEIFLVREGAVQVTLAGKNTNLGPGGVGYVASNVEHGILNVGDSSARYFVIALGTDRPSPQARVRALNAAKS